MIIKEFTSPINSKETIVDVEIENDISDGWDYEKGIVVTCGFLYQDKIKIIQKEKDDDSAKFINAIKSELYKHKLPYAFNFSMEKGCIFNLTTHNFYFKEIKPFKGRGWNKDKFFTELCKTKDIKIEIKDPLNGDGSKVIPCYANGKYEDIIKHNYNCLVKEAYILKYKNELFEQFKSHISPNGWYEG